MFKPDIWAAFLSDGIGIEYECPGPSYSYRLFVECAPPRSVGDQLDGLGIMPEWAWESAARHVVAEEE